ncbi:Cell cycle protein [Corynebacterium camporealensis]|uniref:Cell cycle protein n=1 Tax=Corynebacterium camporealensis TaxID=161896 RepID=A0A0F6T9M5_9CORY|nr:Cell cycle protein [Corynebacterium camporealensis]AVH87585.1 Cell cycle protein [Corynebacterium camporealensis]
MLELAPARPREARLLCLVALIVVAGSLLVELARDDSELGWPAFRVPVILCGLGLVVYVALCFLAPKADQVIFPAAFLLNGIGLVMLRRLDVALDFSLAKRHLLWTIVGLGLLVAVLVVVREHRVLQRYSYLLGLAGLIFLAAPLVSPQPVESDARIWIKIGSFSVQLGEFAKVLLVIFFAMLISQKRAFFAVAGKRFLGLVFHACAILPRLG